MIRSFGNRATEELAAGKSTPRTRRIPTELRRIAIRKLTAVEEAINLSDLRSPPGNHLEALSGNLAGYHSVRINLQWRIVFRWHDGGAEDVQIIDYHR